MRPVATTTRERERQFIAEQLAIVKRSVDQLREIAAEQRRQPVHTEGPLVRAARALERALGIGR
jgi:hypothetical protein